MFLAKDYEKGAGSGSWGPRPTLPKPYLIPYDAHKDAKEAPDWVGISCLLWALAIAGFGTLLILAFLCWSYAQFDIPRYDLWGAMLVLGCVSVACGRLAAAVFNR